MSRPRIYFGRNIGNEVAMHESENRNNLDEIFAVLTEAGFLEILSGTEADDITVILNSAQEHTEEDLRTKGYKKVAIIS